MEIMPLDPGKPCAYFESHATQQAMFCSGTTGFSFRGRFALPAEWCLLGYIHDTQKGSWCHGTALEAGMAFTVLPEGISEFKLAAQTRLSVILVRLNDLKEKFSEQEPYSVELPSRMLSLFRLSGQGGNALREHYEQTYRRLFYGHSQSSPLNGDEARLLLGEHLEVCLAAQSEDRPSYSRGRHTHYRILQRVEHFMRANIRHDIYLSELCMVAGASERALRYAFNDLLGVSPYRYLSMLRLCTACRGLSRADVGRRSVKSVALSCGLWDLSRFADNYHHMFGELPHDTLMRTPLRISDAGEA
ncbi:helix-turn-helix domain-containing protein [Dyella caseinilytica]|nr:helix-turn-helix domain-containing protein [Dyella caseinilytica]GGA13021.1 hypothetical protein GCM10011408_38240 [Dyella caseinilytica]